MTFDEARAQNPKLGLALYAYAPGGVVVLEIIDGETLYEFKAATAQAAIDQAFPPAQAEQVQQPAAPKPTSIFPAASTPEKDRAPRKDIFA